MRQPFSDALPAGKFLGMQRFNLGFIFARWHLQDEARQNVLGEAVTLRRVYFQGEIYSDNTIRIFEIATLSL